MKKILIFGNSGSGKSTLAKKFCAAEQLAHLDLDVLAWEPTSPPERKALSESEKAISHFIQSNPGWVIEGCYADLLEIAVPFSNEIIFLNLPVDTCVDNAKNRPWEPHKYETKEAQDGNLEMLIEWIRQYADRMDTFSQAANTALYKRYSGKKAMFTNNHPNL